MRNPVEVTWNSWRPRAQSTWWGTSPPLWPRIRPPEVKKQMKYKELEKHIFFGICCIIGSINIDQYYPWGGPYFEFSDPDMGIRIQNLVRLKCALFEKMKLNIFFSCTARLSKVWFWSQSLKGRGELHWRSVVYNRAGKWFSRIFSRIAENGKFQL